MNDFLRSAIFLSGITMGAVGGFLTAGSEEASRAPEKTAARVVVAEATEKSNPSAGRITARAVPPEKRLDRVLTGLTARAASVSGNGVLALLNECWESPGGFYQVPLLIDIAAQHDPRGCYDALCTMDRQSRGSTQCWTSLFRHWLPAEPEAALQALLDLPDLFIRRDAGSQAIDHLGKVNPELHVKLLSEHGPDLYAAGIQNVSWPVPEARRSGIDRYAGRARYVETSNALQGLQQGSPEARRVAETASPGILNPEDFRQARGQIDEKGEALSWLAAQPSAAAREALLMTPQSILKHPQLSTDPEIRAAVIRRLAVQHAARPDYMDPPRKEWIESLTEDERAIAAEALHMDTTLSPERQAAVMKLLTREP